MDDSIRQLIFKAIDQTISSEDFDRLQDAIEQDAEVRTAYLRAVHMSGTLEDLASESAASEKGSAPAVRSNPNPKRQRGLFFSHVAPAWNWLAAAAVLLAVGGTAFWFGQRNQSSPAERSMVQTEDSASPESRIAGHATLRRAVGIKWPEKSDRHYEGDVLPNGELVFEDGLAEIDFFCGATLIVEGPAHLDIESDWEVQVVNGRIRASVPPAARGFVVKAAGTEIVDLGTEFAVDVGTDSAQVAVIDGEVELRGGGHDGRHLVTGEGQALKGDAASASLLEKLRTKTELDHLRREADDRAFARWRAGLTDLQTDPRLIAYYPIAEGLSGRTVPNTSLTGSIRDGLLVGPVSETAGRFGPESTGLQFDRPGARVRTRIDGEFQAFTFACWVRIDSLENRYNALFMGDGYENGEPHWQIRDDGRILFSVMVDEDREIEYYSDLEQKMVLDAGFHRVYLTEPFWDPSMKGRWFHLAAVYDPAGRSVTQYVNGVIMSRHQIEDELLVKQLRIGPAEIGNWGQPFRESPRFAVRNLNGIVDEMIIFNAALSEGEISELYELGKPAGY